MPTSLLDFAWTNYGTGNVEQPRGRGDHRRHAHDQQDAAFGEYIGQHNNGNHTTLYDRVNTYLAGLDVPAAIVDPYGNFIGWATFHVISATGGSGEAHQRLLPGSFESSRLSITGCSANDCPRYLGSYILKLTN